jgi:hypothetical protein
VAEVELPTFTVHVQHGNAIITLQRYGHERQGQLKGHLRVQPLELLKEPKDLAALVGSVIIICKLYTSTIVI